MTKEKFEKINQHLKQLHAGGAKRENVLFNTNNARALHYSFL